MDTYVPAPAERMPSCSGETSLRLGDRDWHGTPLGDPETWPPSLRTAVELLLASHAPVAIAWGPELLALYNEPFAALMRVPGWTSLAARPLGELCPELWRRVGPVAADVMRRGESVLMEDELFCIYRNGYAEEAYLRVRCRPIADRAHDAGGMLILLDESTDHVVGIRRTAALRDVSAARAEAHSVEAACRSALDALSRHSSDVPFALLYLVDAGAPGEARLAGTAGIAAGSPASPSRIPLDPAGGATSWPIAAALERRGRTILADLLDRFDPLPAGQWPLAPRSAVLVPLTTTVSGDPDAVLVVGVSARHDLDESYLDYIELVASHVAAALAAGRLHADEERLAAARAAARLARARRRARERALRARFEGIVEERTRLAREIHDTLLQGITGIALQLRAAIPRVQSSPDAARVTLDRIAELAEQTSREARRAVWGIRPAPLDGLAFVRALESAARQTIGETPLALRVRAVGDPAVLGPETQEAVLGVVREAVANAVRHARASAVRLTLRYEPRRLRIVVSDDGCGFVVAPDARAYPGHWGLLGMRERVRRIGGALRVRSAPGRGTKVVLEAPIAPAGRGRRTVAPAAASAADRVVSLPGG